MARSRRWKGYQPPQAPRTEEGRVVDDLPPAPPASPDESRPGRTPKSTSKPAAQRERRAGQQKQHQKKAATPRRHAGRWWLAGIVAAIVVVVAIVANSDGDDDGNDGVRREALTAAFVEKAFANARAEAGGGSLEVVSVRLSEYDVSVEYYDPNRDESRIVETDTYGDGYDVRVEPNRYRDYRPRPFDLTVVDPTRFVASVTDALADADDPDYVTAEVRVDPDSGRIEQSVRVSADEDVDRTLDLGPAS